MSGNINSDYTGAVKSSVWPVGLSSLFNSVSVTYSII